MSFGAPFSCALFQSRPLPYPASIDLLRQSLRSYNTHQDVAACSRFCRLRRRLKQNRLVCAVCTKSFGRGAGYSCHSCRNTFSAVLVAVGSLFILLIVLLLVLTVVFLVGGLDAVGNIHRSLTSRLSISMPAVSSSRPVPSASQASAFHNGSRSALFTAAFDAGSKPPLGDTPVGVTLASPTSAASTDGSLIGVRLLTMTRSDKASKVWTEGSRSGKEIADCEGKHDLPGPTAVAVGARAGAGAGAVGSRGRCCGIEERIKRLWSRVPLDKLKILVVMWQILTVFPSIAAVDFPPVYSRFLSWIDVVNFDLGNFFSASCVFPGLNFYQRLLVTTLTPLALVGVLVVTYHIAKRRAGIGMSGMIQRRAAWSRHMAAGLLLTFLVSLGYRLGQGARVGKRVKLTRKFPHSWRRRGSSWVMAACVFYREGLVLDEPWLWGSGGKGRSPPLITTLVPSSPFTLPSLETASCTPGTYRSRASSLRRRPLQVFTSASTVVFKTFACENDAVAGQSYLRADYSLSCKTKTHIRYRIYAGFMLLVGSLSVLSVDKRRVCCQR